MIKAYFFDWMKTLGDYKDIIDFKEYLTPEEYASFTLTKELDDLGLDDKKKKKILYGLNGTILSLFEDSLEIIKELKEKGYKICLISNTYPITPNRIRKLFGNVLKYFNVVTFSSEVGIKKPNPEIFTFTLNQLNKLNNKSILPKEVIMIGNSEEHDINPALSLGMQARLIDRTKQNLRDVI